MNTHKSATRTAQQSTSVQQTGKVKWFRKDKGYGFIVPNAGGQDVFVHITAVEAAALDPNDIREETPITYTLCTGRNGRIVADDLKLISTSQRPQNAECGTVNWFNVKKGYGFITPENNAQNDVFVHIEEVRKLGLDTLHSDQKVRFHRVRGRNGRQMAGNIRLL